MWDLIVYDVEFPDGTIRELSLGILDCREYTNTSHSDGYSLTLKEGIVDCGRCETGAVSKDDGYVV
jgi:hypothetical protein